MRATIGALVLAAGLMITGCGSDANATDSTPSTSSTSTTLAPTTSSSTIAVQAEKLLVSFPDPVSADAWTNVDDSVMGGISASESTWIDDGGTGALVFSGVLSTESNGGFASTLGPLDRSIGGRATGTTALRIKATGDGRTYLLQLRAGEDGGERWIARFTPRASSTATGGELVPFDSFEAVNRFLRPVTPSTPLDPSTISQIGVYVLDAQVGEFRLVLGSINAEN